MIHFLNSCSKKILWKTLRDKCILKFIRNINRSENVVILGIETSCDDTAVGIVNSKGEILGNSHYSQELLHTKYGGIIPGVAKDLHIKHITELCENTLKLGNLKLRDITAIATTVEPGLPMSLHVGRNFGVRLSEMGKKPFIPIHHMEAHALVARMTQQVDFPFLVLLISGGHCLLAVVENVATFRLLGRSIDTAPGEAFDKIARRLKLKNMPDFKNCSSGAAVEIAASRGDNPSQFPFQVPLTHYRDCNFSFAGAKTSAYNQILNYEKNFNITGDKIIPDVYNFCAAFQLSVTRHLCQRTQRAIEFVDRLNLLPEDRRTLVVSGGVARNNFIFKSVSTVCSELGYKCIRPPSDLCTDNGLMIAWNGIERWRENEGVLHEQDDIAKVEIKHKSPLGTNWTHKVLEESIKCKWIKINPT